MTEAHRVKEAFCVFDRDGDGFIAAREFGTALRALGCNPSDQELDGMLGDKTELNYEEFAALAKDKVKSKDLMVKELTKAFSTFDRDNSGTLSSSELKHVLENIGEKLDHDDIEKLVQEGDPSTSGSIKYEQFAKLLIG